MNRLFFVAVVFSLFLSCSKSSSGPTLPASTNGLMPLSVGNYWQFNKVDYDSNTAAAIDTSLDEIDIVEELEVGSTIYYQQTQLSMPILNAGSFFVNVDSNTLEKIDSALEYTFFKRVPFDSMEVDSWADTVTSRCQGHNFLYGFTDTTVVDSYSCLRNIVYVNDCSGTNFQQWVYYLKPGLGLVRILHYVLKSDGTFYLQFSEDLKSYHTNS
jgi:hypothetical protein